MKTQQMFLIAVTAALAGCASMNDSTSGQASVQNAVYRVDSGSNNGSLKPVVVQSADSEKPAESKPMTIYWFFGGR